MRPDDVWRDEAWAALVRAVRSYGAACAEWGSESGAYESSEQRRQAYVRVLNLVDVLVPRGGGDLERVRRLYRQGES